MFDAVAQPQPESTDNEIFYCKGSGADGRGLYTQEGFVVLKGSFGRKDIIACLRGTADERARNKLLETKTAEIQGDKLVFVQDVLFGSPSRAAMAVMGRSANGWLDWKNKDNQTLDAVKRQTILE